MKPANHSSWKWNQIRPRQSDYSDIISDLYSSLMSWLPFMDSLQLNKNDYELNELNTFYIGYLQSYIIYRNKEIEFILSDDKYYEEVTQFASDNVMFDILLDGYVSDSNRNQDLGSNQVLPLLPYSNQLDLIHSLEYDSKSLHIEKSRRAGASTLLAFRMRRNLRFKKNMVMLASNKSSKDIDLKDDTKNNSTFSRIDFLFNHSIFVPNNWTDDKIYNTKERQSQGTAIYRGHKPILIVYGTNRLDGSVFGKGTGTGSATHEYYADEIDVWANEHENIEDELFSAVSSSTNRMILFSTYRSINYSFFKIKKENNTKVWKFIKLHWKDNPTCSQSWYDTQSGKLNNPVKVARELDINPSASIKGRIWPNLIDKHFISKSDALIKWGNMNDWDTIIASDNGGTKMSQNYNLIRIHKPSSTIYIEDTFFIDNTSQPEDVYEWALSHGFDIYNNTIYGDRAIKDNFTFTNHSTAYLLRRQGFNVVEVANQDIAVVHRDIRKRIKLGQFYVNKDIELLETFLKLYRYKDDGTVNKKDSHLGDAISYGIKGYFLSSKVELIER